MASCFTDASWELCCSSTTISFEFHSGVSVLLSLAQRDFKQSASAREEPATSIFRMEACVADTCQPVIAYWRPISLDRNNVNALLR
jgi:hypothetical protein